MFNVKSKLFILNFLFLFSVFSIAQAESLDISFVDKFRFSQESFLAGENIRIYSTLQNNSGFDLRGTIRFYDNEKFLGDFDFFVTNQKTIEAWVDWFSLGGEHNLLAKIYDVKKLEIAKEPENVYLDQEVLVLEKTNVDIDTDKDGEGNKVDLDDDNDGILDIEEIKQGTNPLIFNKAVEPVVVQKEESEVPNATSSKIIKDEKKETEGLLENVKNITETTLEKSKTITETTKDFLEKQKEGIDFQIQAEKEIELVQKELEDSSVGEKEENSNFYTASIIDAVPNLKEIYSFILGVLIFILNTWWLFLVVAVTLLWLIWKMIKKRITTRRF